MILADGISTDPVKISAIKTWPIPTNMEELKSFLGFAGYYRKFVADYAKLVRPLNDLLAQYLRNDERTKPLWRWSSPPVLAYPDFSKSFTLNIDASREGLGVHYVKFRTS